MESLGHLIHFICPALVLFGLLYLAAIEKLQAPTVMCVSVSEQEGWI